MVVLGMVFGPIIHLGQDRYVGRFYFMKIIVFLALFPCFAVADCEIPLESIKSSVKQVLLPLHEQFNILIEKEDFRLAHQQILEIAEQIKACEIYHRDYERENYHFSRWGEKSLKYLDYSRALTSVTMQLKAAHESYELGLLRPIFFKTGMWEKVAYEFYQTRI